MYTFYFHCSNFVLQKVLQVVPGADEWKVLGNKEVVQCRTALEKIRSSSAARPVSPPAEEPLSNEPGHAIGADTFVIPLATWIFK